MKIRTNKNVLQCASFLQQLAPFSYKSLFVCVCVCVSSEVWDCIGKQTKRNQTWSVVKASRKVPSHAGNAALSRERGLGPKRVEAMQTRARCEVIACRAGRKNSLPLPSRLVRMTSQLICVCSRADTARCRSKISAGRWGGTGSRRHLQLKTSVFAKQMARQAGKAGGF